MSIDWRARDRQLRGFVHAHPSFAEQWVRAEIFDSRKTASRRATKLASRERDGIRYIGGVQLNGTGPKHNVFCNGWRPTHLRHEVAVTEEIIPFWRQGLEVLRGSHVDQRLRPDFTVYIGELPLHGEVDLDTEGYDQVRAQMERYGEAHEYNVWFAPTTSRVEGILRLATPYTVASECGSNVWLDTSGAQMPVEALFPTRYA